MPRRSPLLRPRAGRRDPPAPWWRCATRRRSRARAAAAAAATRASRRRPPAAGCAAAASKSGIVSIGFDGASSRIRSTPSGGAPVWSYSITSTPHGPDVVEQLLVPVVGALGERDRAAGRQHRQDDAGDGRHPGRKEQRPAPLERPERGLDRDRIRLLCAGIGVRARLACRVVRPGGRAVEGSAHGSTLARAHRSTRRRLATMAGPPVVDSAPSRRNASTSAESTTGGPGIVASLRLPGRSVSPR